MIKIMPTNSHDNVIGSVQLRSSTRLGFSTGFWKGQPYAHVRKFVSNERYEGPTKSRLALPAQVLLDLIATASPSSGRARTPGLVC